MRADEHLCGTLPLEREAERRILEVAWGSEPELIQTQALAATIVRVAVSGISVQQDRNGRPTEAGMIGTMRPIDRILTALAHPDLSEANLLALIHEAEQVRGLQLLRALLEHPASTPVVVARAAAVGWRGAHVNLDAAALEYLKNQGTYGRAAYLLIKRYNTSDPVFEHMILETGALRPEEQEILTTLMKDAPVARHNTPIRRDLTELLDKARLLGN